MKTCFLVAFCATFLMPLTAGAAPEKPASKVARRTVLDYFRLLPSNYFESPDRRYLLKKEHRPVIDLENDYLKTQGGDLQAELEVAIFRYGGRDVVAVSSNNAPDGTPVYSFELLRFERGQWKDVTKALSPIASNPYLHFVVPRHGTTIKVFRRNGITYAELIWKNGRFSATALRKS